MKIQAGLWTIDIPTGFYTGGMNTVWGVVMYILNMTLFIGIALALIFTIIGGIKWITALGDVKKVTSARGTVTSALIGLILLLGSFIFLNLLAWVFQVDLGTGQPLKYDYSPPPPPVCDITRCGDKCDTFVTVSGCPGGGVWCSAGSVCEDPRPYCRSNICSATAPSCSDPNYCWDFSVGKQKCGGQLIPSYGCICDLGCAGVATCESSGPNNGYCSLTCAEQCVARDSGGKKFCANIGICNCSSRCSGSIGDVCTPEVLNPSIAWCQ